MEKEIDPPLIRQSRTYERTVKAARLFLGSRLIDSVREEIPSARLFCSGLKSLDVYATTKLRLNGISSKRTMATKLRSAIEGLDLLIGARYIPDFLDHRSFATLALYDQAWNQVVDSIGVVSDEKARTILENFETALNSIVSGNGLYIVNWKHLPPQSTTLYSKVGLEVSRLCCGDLVGIYKVQIPAKSKAPHHSHCLLEEHHFLPEKIDGVHQLGRRAARCTDPDILYIRRGEIHSFRNDEEKDRSFLFISGSRELGPWDFVQDITTHPEIAFPEPDQVEDSVESLGGRRLRVEGTSGNAADPEKRELVKRRRLSPKAHTLTHNEIIVNRNYAPSNGRKDLLMYVARGRGCLQIWDRGAIIRQGDVFVIKSQMPAEIVRASGETLILYEFGMTRDVSRKEKNSPRKYRETCRKD